MAIQRRPIFSHYLSSGDLILDWNRVKNVICCQLSLPHLCIKRDLCAKKVERNFQNTNFYSQCGSCIYPFGAFTNSNHRVRWGDIQLHPLLYLHSLTKLDHSDSMPGSKDKYSIWIFSPVTVCSKIWHLPFLQFAGYGKMTQLSVWRCRKLPRQYVHLGFHSQCGLMCDIFK